MKVRTGTHAARYVANLADALFKPLDGGYLFEAPNSWMAGPGRRYIVSAEQRSALLTIMTPRWRGLRAYFIIAAIGALVAGGLAGYAAASGALLRAIAGHNAPSTFDLIVVLLMIVIPIYVVGTVSRRRHLRRLEPILAAAIPTGLEMTSRDRNRARSAVLPSTYIVVGALIWGGQGAISLTSLLLTESSQPLLSDPHAYLAIFNLVAAVALVVMAGTTLVRRWRQRA